MEAFEQLEVWKRGCRLCTDLFRSLSGCKFYSFKDQVCRAALSIPSNIAEGYERNSSREFSRFLKVAKGSCAELRTQLYIGIEAKLLESEQARDFLQETVELSKMLQGLITQLESKLVAQT